MDRRQMVSAMMAFAAIGSLEAAGQESGTLGESHVFRFSEMKESKSASTGGWSRAVMQGTLPTGEFVEVHETMLPPGKMPHPPHRHTHSEFILLREGEVEYMPDDKIVEKVRPGDVIYTASGRLHGMKSTGTVPAVYYVVAVGVQKVL